jgi:hypothetical protein
MVLNAELNSSCTDGLGQCAVWLRHLQIGVTLSFLGTRNNVGPLEACGDSRLE